jgi:hypothetical protein
VRKHLQVLKNSWKFLKIPEKLLGNLSCNIPKTPENSIKLLKTACKKLLSNLNPSVLIGFFIQDKDIRLSEIYINIQLILCSKD